MQSSTKEQDLAYRHRSHLQEKFSGASLQKRDKSKKRIKTAAQLFQVTDRDAWRGDPCWLAHWVCSSPNPSAKPREHPAFTSLQSPQRQPVLGSLCVYIWARFSPKTPRKDVGHAHVDAIPKKHNKLCLLSSAPGGTSRWAVRNLSAGSRSAWLETQEGRKQQHPPAETQSLSHEKWHVKRMWNKRAFELVSVGRK